MGQSATLYRISKHAFERLAKDPSGFNIEMAEGYATFEQNFEGLIFLLGKLSSDVQKAMIREIFYPGDFLGEKADLGNQDLPDDLSFPETESISYLSTEKVKAIKQFLDGIDKQQLLNVYDAEELNEQGIYPCVWHNDESFDQAFNKRHITEGFENLTALFGDAVRKDNLMVVFVG